MTTRQEITTLVILPVNPDPRSNGIQCYLSLVGQLSSLPGVAYTSGQGCNDSGKAYYNSTWHGCYIAEILLMQDKSLFGALQFVILPDHIDGLACQVYDYLRCEAGDVIQYINLVLAPLYVFGDNNSRPIETMYDNRDSFIFFNKHFLPPDYHLLDIYQEPNLGYLHNVIPVLDAGLNEYPHPVPKTLAIYAGKGHYAVDHSISGEISDIKDYLDSRGIGFSLITRSWPESKQAYLQLIADSIGLIMLDPFTNVLRDALLLGVPVFSAVDGIDYQCYGVSRVASSFINSLSQRRNIREYALSRHFGLARFNLLKQSLFYEAVRKLMKDRQCGVDKVVLPYSHALHQASILKALDLRKQCVVGSLSTATHAITSANQAFEIMIDSKSSTVASGYRQIATEYFSQD